MKLDDISNQLSTKVSIVHFECFAQAAWEYGDVTEAPQTIFLIWINLGKAQHQCIVSALHFPAVPFTEQEGDGVNKPGPPNVRDSWLVLITHP